MSRNARSLLGLAVAVLTYLGSSFHYWNRVGTLIIDDAFVFFRYADNFARGHGFVYNVGEAVEGYTSFLWLLLLGGARSLDLDLVPVSQGLGVLLGTLTVILTWAAARTLLPSLGFASALPSLFLATNRTFCVWSVEGMDAKIFGAVVMAAFVSWLRLGSGRRWKRVPVTGLLVGLLPLARPEGYLFAGALGAFATAETARSRRWRGFKVNAAAALFVAGSHFAYRVFTYRDVVPNTFHAKVVGLQVDNGLRYLSAFLSSNYLFVLGFLTLLGAALFLADRQHRAPKRLAVTWLLLHSAYLVAIGGDYFEFRFLDVLLPFVGLLTLQGLVGIRERLSGERTRNVAFFLLAVVWIAVNFETIRSPIVPREWLTTPERESRFTAEFDRAGRWMAENLGPGESIAISPAGVIAYRNPQRYILDLFGLNDREIARVARRAVEHPTGHQRIVDHDYVRSRGISYFIGHPRFVKRPWPRGRVASVEVEPGLYFLLQPLQPGTKFEPRVYPLGMPPRSP